MGKYGLSDRGRRRFGLMKPVTTVIGSYPILPDLVELERYSSISKMAMEGEEPSDLISRTIELSVKDFISAGIEVPSTGQTRKDFIRLFLDPDHVSNIDNVGYDVSVNGRIARKSSIRLSDVHYAKRFLPKSRKFKEPLTDPYTLARNCKIVGSSYRDVRELSFDLAKTVLNPEALELQSQGGVDYVQFDGPYYSSEHMFPEYIGELYQSLLEGINVPVVLHVCGDTASIFKELIKIKGIDILSLDFTYNPELIDEVAKHSFDQKIGFGCVKTATNDIEPVSAIRSLIEIGVKKIGEDRIAMIHPACGQRQITTDAAYMKNVNMVIARNEVFYGEPLTKNIIAKASPPKDGSDLDGYFLLQVDHESKIIIATRYSSENIPKVVVKGNSGEKVLNSILLSELAPDARQSSYLGYELSKAEMALRSNIPYRQHQILKITK
ncbi:MAG: hypothetical protein O6846_04325 [Thaumarchaeota archaeon]|nr:hypothetical protein [Nitrososphaerota archaeon]